MRLFITSIIVAMLGIGVATAQNRLISNYISTLATPQGTNSAYAEVSQDPLIKDALSSLKPGTARASGMNVCVFFDNGQNARSGAYGAAGRLSGTYGVPVWVVYQNPFFKTMAGYCMDKLEAYQLLGVVKGQFPSAVIVKSSFSLNNLIRSSANNSSNSQSNESTQEQNDTQDSDQGDFSDFI